MGDTWVPGLQDKWQYLMENSLELLLFFGPDGCVIEGNKKAKQELGYEESIKGVSISKIFQKMITFENGQLIIVDEDAKKAAEMGKTIETVAYRKNLTCFDVDLKIVVEERDGGHFGMCSFLNTAVRVGAIKDMVKAKEKVEDATKVRNEFVSNVTHELRTPVNGILGISKNLLETELDDQQKESINIIHMCCSNMIEIINNLLVCPA